MEENVKNIVPLTLKVSCSICSEFFKNSDIIYSTTKCGHVFHRQCIFRWLKYSQTCPQCRANVHEYIVHQVLLNFGEPLELNEAKSYHNNEIEWQFVDKSFTVKELTEFGFKLGLDKDKDPVFAARVNYEDDLVPAYYVPQLEGVYIGWNGEAQFLNENIELLDISRDKADYKWVSAKKGNVPINAFAVGYTEMGERYYFVRNFYDKKMRFGKVYPQRKSAYILYNDKEVKVGDYEVLVRIPKEDNAVN